MKNSDWIETRITGSGSRLTTSRRKIVALIKKREGIFSAQDLLEADRALDKVSVYRTLELLESLDIIHPTLTLDGHQMYELHPERHHHHIVCVSCHQDECVPCDVTIPRNIAGFAKIHHEVHFTGVCEKCI